MTDRKLKETQLDLMIGCIVHGLVFELIGLIVADNRLAYSLGILLGTLTALACSYSMYRGIDWCTGKDPLVARRNMTILSVFRSVAMFGVSALGLFSGLVSFYGVIIGLIGLKVSAYLHVYTNVYITRKFFRKLVDRL